MYETIYFGLWELDIKNPNKLDKFNKIDELVKSNKQDFEEALKIVKTKENLNLRRKKKDYTFVNRKIRLNLLYYY